MRSKTGDIGLVECGERVHIGEEAERLRHIGELGTDACELRLKVGDCLCSLCLNTTCNETAVTQTKLSGNDDPVACANYGCVRSDWCSHDFKVRRITARYPYGVVSTTRRKFLNDSARLALIGAASASFGSLLSACGRGGGSGLPDDVQIVQRFPQILVPGKVRLPISLASNGGLLTVDDPEKTPRELSARIVRLDSGRDESVANDLIAVRHDVALSVPYWPFFAEISTPGFYRLILDGGPSDGAAFQVFERGAIRVPGIGDQLPAFDTPTFDNAQRVDPLCTRIPEGCPLHAVSLRDALSLGKPLALLIGTPAHCSTGTCTPALDALVSIAARRDDFATFLHAEVYADRNATTVAPIVSTLGMTFEPALFVTDGSGVVVARLDAVFDEVEIASVLA